MRSWPNLDKDQSETQRYKLDIRLRGNAAYIQEIACCTETQPVLTFLFKEFLPHQ